ncbi:hypothetical protein U3516DRAFT_734837 [Neocallimastix sp. 'constans']
MIFNTRKPINGFGGILYQQWYFNIIENKTLYQSSIIYYYSKDIIIDSQGTSLYNVDDKNNNFETMLYLFHKHNNWFNGDILVIQDDKYSILSYEYKDKITCHYNGLNELKDIFDI